MVSKIPKSENGPMHIHCTEKNEYVISWNLTQGRFTLWQKVKNGFEKITTSNNPLNFYEQIKKIEK